MSGFWIRQVQKQIGVSTLVSSQERRALFVLLINRGSTADEPVVNRGFCSSVGFLDMPCIKKVRKNKKASFHWVAAKKKSAFRANYGQLIGGSSVVYPLFFRG